MQGWRSLWICMALLAGGVSVCWAQLFEDRGVEISSPRTEAIGGPHAALTDDLTTMFTNPAGFRSAGPEVSFAQLTLRLSGPIFTIADIVSQASAGTQNILANPKLTSLFGSLEAVGTLDGPLAFGYVGQGLGFGFFNSSSLSFTSAGTSASAGLGESVLFAGGYAFRIPLPESLQMTLDAGLMIKSFIRGQVELSEDILSILGLFLGGVSAETLLALPFSLDVGAGLDVGVTYSWANLISFGVVCQNLPTFTLENSYGSLAAFAGGGAPSPSYGYVPIDLSSGIMITPDIPFVDRFISAMKFFVDYDDILDFVTHPATASNPILHVGVGTELTLLEILSVRAGFYDGYFSAGLGINLSYMKFDAAMFGRELSLEPGVRPAYNLAVGLQFSM